MGQLRRAVFLDRDGTLSLPYHYPSRPEHLVIPPVLPPLLSDLQRMGALLIVVTNQSGLARGYFTEEDLEAMHAHVRRELGEHGVRLDAIYHCPHHPRGVVPELRLRCRCRKPEPGMLTTAAAEFGIDLDGSWMVGDSPGDAVAGVRAACRTALVGAHATVPVTGPRHTRHASTAEALRHIIAQWHRTEPPRRRPAAW